MNSKDRAVEAFKEYANLYDVKDIKIKLKIDHTYRVAEISSRIGAAVGADADFCWFLGLLHDIGRFEQLRLYGTFKDAESLDHAELGADILFHDGLIDNFPAEFFTIPGTVGGEQERKTIAETAIRLHNKLSLPDTLDEGTLLHCRVLRDADKCDIFRVLTEDPYDKRNERIVISSRSGTAAPARSDVMDCVMAHRCVPRTFERTEVESLISQCCMPFELEYPISRSIVAEQGYLEQLMNLPVEDEGMKAQLDTLRTEMKRAWGN